MDNITVTVKWIQQLGLVYNASVTVVPLAPLMFNGSGSSSVQLVLEYNSVYNLSVVAVNVAPCVGHTEISFIALNYGEGIIFPPFHAHTIVHILEEHHESDH